jgi:hypothetical protein
LKEDAEHVSKVQICHGCFNDVVKHNANGKVEYQLDQCRKFSLRNGYGPIPIPARPVGYVPYDAAPRFPQGVPQEVRFSKECIEFELHTLLDSFTAAEEAAIREITVLLSIVRLKGGNLGTKGTTTCVWNKSVVNHLLPNLPQECKVLVIKARTNQGGPDHVRMKSYQYKRKNIQRALELSKAIDHERFRDIRIEPSRLQAWAEEGDLLGVSVTTPDTSTCEDDDGGGAPNGPDSGNDNDGRESGGPAPLQNAVEEDEVFVGTSTGSATVEAPLREANEALQHFQELASELNRRNHARDNSNNNNGDTSNETTHQLHLRFPAGSDRVEMDQAEAKVADGFANMNSTPYAWAMAVPTLFRPSLVDGEWKVLGDQTEREQAVERGPVQLGEWAEWLMWRSDARPAEHPLFSLVLFHEITRTRLFKQAAVAVSMSDIITDPSASLESVREQMTDPTQVEKIATRVNHFAGNVRGTDQHFRSVFNDFQATVSCVRDHVCDYARVMSVVSYDSCCAYHHSNHLIPSSSFTIATLTNSRPVCSTL